MSRAGASNYSRLVPDRAGQGWLEPEELRRFVPVFALVVAVLAAVTDASSAADLVFVAIPVVAFAAWAYVPGVPLTVVSVAVLAPVVVAQRSGQLEPLMFEASLLAFVVGHWSRSVERAVLLGLLTAAAPVLAALIQDPAEIAVGIWILGIVFPWIVARALVRQEQLALELEGTRRELARQAVLAERREIARDVHDFVGHGLAAVMLQVTSARHVLRRDIEAAEDALRSAEEVGRRSMRELRRTVALLRHDDETGVPPPVPLATEIPGLVDQARTAGLDVELRMRGDVERIPPGIGVAVYRIAQEALANAARHAPRAQTVLRLELTDGRVVLVAETSGPIEESAGEPERARYGLVGMRERATALGGEFDAGPTAAGWRVACRLPLEASDERGPNRVNA
jgi:signal transduction histidine kinase